MLDAIWPNGTFGPFVGQPACRRHRAACLFSAFLSAVYLRFFTTQMTWNGCDAEYNNFLLHYCVFEMQTLVHCNYCYFATTDGIYYQVLLKSENIYLALFRMYFVKNVLAALHLFSNFFLQGASTSVQKFKSVCCRRNKIHACIINQHKSRAYVILCKILVIFQKQSCTFHKKVSNDS